MKHDTSKTQDFYYLNVNGKDIWLPKAFRSFTSIEGGLPTSRESMIKDDKTEKIEDEDYTKDDFFKAFDCEEEEEEQES